MAKSRKQDDLLGMEEPADDFGFLGAPEPEETAKPPAAPPSKSSAPARAAKRTAEPEEADEATAMPSTAAAPAAAEGYVVLARRYRPQTFDQIVGQEHVREALRGAIATGQIGHAYLFTGPRGTGKTSSARILAKALNCQRGGPRPDPCGECASCRTIAAGSSLDVIEIDAASNTGVDSIRELRSGVALAPFSRYKVYIVDEVHMLSTAAFNALLKTLEEPPPQVIFVLATTELQKVPETIVSRCQVFNFRRFTTAEIVAQLDKILTTELKRREIAVSDEDRAKILELVARSAEGGMRDAQVALDQVLVFSRDRLDYESVRRFLGSVEAEVLDGFVRGLHERNTEELLLLIEQMTSMGQDLELFVKNLADYVRDLLILRSAPDKPELVNAAPDRHRAIRELSEELPAAFLLNLASTALRLAEEMKGSSQARFLLEFAVIRLTKVDPVDDISKIVARLQELEKKIGSGGGPPQDGGAGGGGGGASAPSARLASSGGGSAQARTAAPVEPPSRPTPQPPIRREAVEEVEAEPVPAPPPSEPVAEVTPEPPPVISGLPGLEEFQKRLLESVAARNAYGLHTSLLETCLVSLNDSYFVLGAKAGDAYTLAHLDTSHNQTILREVAKELTGREMAVRVQPVQEMQNPFMAVAPAGTAPPRPAPTPPPRPAPRPAAANREAAPQPVSDNAGKAAAPAAAQNADDGEDAPRTIVFTSELRSVAKAPVKGAALRQLLEKHTDLQELVDKVKAAFQIDDAQITFSRSII